MLHHNRLRTFLIHLTVIVIAYLCVSIGAKFECLGLLAGVSHKVPDGYGTRVLIGDIGYDGHLNTVDRVGFSELEVSATPVIIVVEANTYDDE